LLFLQQKNLPYKGDFAKASSVTHTGHFWQTLDKDSKDTTPMVNDFKNKSYLEQPKIPAVLTKVTSVEDEQVHTKYKNKEDENKIPEITKVIITGIKGFKAGHDTYQDGEANLVLKKCYVLSQLDLSSKH
jgi:hypothetical protein